MHSHPIPPSAPLFVGDDLALDFINSAFGMGQAHRDCFVDDAAVVAWLKRAGALAEDVDATPDGLLQLALELRDNAGALVDAATSGRRPDVSVVNRLLEAGHAPAQLKWNDAGQVFEVDRPRRRQDAAALLEPVARAILKLLTEPGLELVRQCEAHDCTLMFRDLTKSRRRRWCSMAACGNRMKVAAFRARNKA